VNRRHGTVVLLLAAMLPLLWTLSVAVADETLARREQQAIRAAVERVAPSVVRIETVGGLEVANQVLFGTGPTTGLVLSSDGYIISSAFNFAARPTSVLVGLPDGSRVPARIVATDFNRMLTLLKIEIDQPLVVPEAVPTDEMRVGQWAIAVGRTFDGGQPNLSVGVLSAKQRIWGKAVQTDAKVSPANYGGPLIDIRGQVLGLLVPLSPSASEAVAGVEWYDSGIGFAIPLADVMKILPRLEKGQNLVRGLLGINLKPGNQFADPPVVAIARAGSPAYRAGILPGDRIVSVDGHAIGRMTDLLSELKRRYAGDQIELAVRRGEEQHAFTVELVAKLKVYEHPFLGVLPLRDASDEPGTVVRFVYPESPAAKAGIEPGDRLLALNGEAAADRDGLQRRIDALDVGQRVLLDLSHDGQPRQVSIVLGSLPLDVPAELPPARTKVAEPSEARPRVGTFALQIPEFENKCRVYVPESFRRSQPRGLLLWLCASADVKDQKTIERWQPWSDGLIVATLYSANAGRWLRTEAAFVEKVADAIQVDYAIDPTRVVIGGRGAGGEMAYAVAFANRQRYRGVAVNTAPLRVPAPQNEPPYRLAFYLATATKVPLVGQIEVTIRQLRSMKFPLTLRRMGEKARAMNDNERAELVRWIDTLDRI